MSEPLPIGYFQFDNLIKNRIPFLLVRTDLAIEAAYGVMEKMHLRNFSLVVQSLNHENAKAAIAERQARKEDPIVVLCEDGKKSLQVAQALCSEGHLNVYYVLGGWQMLEAEMKAESSQ